MKLYIDIGNTNIKVNFESNGVDYYQSYNTSFDYTVDTFYQDLPIEIKREKIERVVISSVVPKKERVIVGMVKKYWSIAPLVLEYPIKTGIKIKTTDPKKVGSDLVALGAYVANHSDNGIIVNLGTTTTVMHVLNKEIQGVAIAAGLGASFESIVNRASLIGDVTLLDDVSKISVGKDTQEAISIGILKGQVGSIKYIVEGIDKSADVFISGGHARKIKKYLPEYSFVKEATIQGMKIIEMHNDKKNDKK